MKTERKNSKQMPRWLMWILMPTSIMIMTSPEIVEARKRRKQEENKKERAIMRNFKIEIKTGFFGNKVTYIQRDKPLSDEELNEIYKV